MKKKDLVSRRTFVKSTAAATAASAFTIVEAKSVRGTQANSMVEIGWVGLGGQGTRDAYLLEKTGKAKIVAIADYFQYRIDNARKPRPENAGRPNPDHIDPKKVFLGLDGYKGIMESKVDAVLLVTPPGFRPEHFKAAVAAKKHIFAEKPLAVDPAGCHTVLEAGEKAKANNLSVIVGLQRHYSKAYRACKKLVDEGALGTIVMAHSAWDMGDLWTDRRGKRADWKTQMDYEIEHWYFFKWLCGDHIVEQSIHNMDVINWMLGTLPIKAYGSGGRLVRKDIGEINDHFNLVYEYPNQVLLNHTCVQIDGVRGDVSETIRGTKGTFTTSSGKGGAVGARIEGVRRGREPEAPIIYAAGQDLQNDDAYFQEAQAFVGSVLGTGEGEDKYRNDTRYGVESTFMSILGREAAYKRECITWDELWNSNKRLTFKASA